MIRRRIRAPFLLGALFPLAALVWLGLAPAPRPAEEQFARGEELLRERIDALRTRTSNAARRLADAAPAPDQAGFAAARAIRSEEGVDGIALLDKQLRTLVWSGRTFDLDPDDDLLDVRRGIVDQSILEHPAHRVLYTARPAGDAIAIAFIAFNERFPVRLDLGEEIAVAAGLHSVELRYATDSVSVPPTTSRQYLPVVIENLAHATFWATTPDEAQLAALQQRTVRAHLLLIVSLAWLGSLMLYWLARTRWHALASIAFVALMRTALYHFRIPDSEVAQTLATGIAALAAVAIVRRARLRPRAIAAAALSVLVLIAATQWRRFVTRVVHVGIDNGLFDPTTSVPGWNAAILICAASGATLALILLILAVFRLVPAVARWRDRVGPLERTAALALVTALLVLPFLHVSHRNAVETELAAHARKLLYPAADTDAEARLDAAVRNAVDPDSGVNYYVAAALENGDNPSHLAFFLWSASGWDPRDPCAVEVYDARLQRVSSFDFDAPPSDLLPRAPTSFLKPDVRRMPGQGAGDSITYRVRDIFLHTIGDEQPAGLARFIMPYRWDLLRSELRPPLFSEPFATLGRSAAQPLVLAELDGAGAVEYVSRGATSDLPRPDDAMLATARTEGQASLAFSYAGRDARMLVVPGSERFAAMVYARSFWEQLPFEAAHVLFVIGIACALWLAWRWKHAAWAFRHTIALFLVLLSVLPVVLLGLYQKTGIERRYEADIARQLRVRLDLAERLLNKNGGEVDNAWCVALSTDHHIDLNVYEGMELIATSRPGVWNTGLLSRQLSGPAYEALVLGTQREYLGLEPFAGAGDLRAGYRRVARDRIIAAPELTDRRALERAASEEMAKLFALYVLAAALAVLLALPVAYLLLRPVRRLQAATREVAAGNLDVEFPAARGRGELGDLERSFASMTRDLRDAQDLRVRNERLAAWREMAQQIAHDVRNPLTPMKLTIQNLLAIHTDDEALFEEEFPRGANVILGEIDRLQRIAGNFSTYARIPQRNLERVELGALLREVAKLHDAAGGIVLNLCEEPVHVRADRDELHRVLHNLIINARDAEARSVTLECRHEQGVRLDVVDDGCGIPPEAMARIFEPSFTTRTRGTGLGLPIVQRIIADLGGSIALDSEPGKGTRVTIRLPASD